MVSSDAAAVIKSSVPSPVAAAAVAVAAEFEAIKTTQSILTNLNLQPVPMLDFDKYALFFIFLHFCCFWFYELSFLVACGEHFVLMYIGVFNLVFNCLCF